jgi:hypothetical protein
VLHMLHALRAGPGHPKGKGDDVARYICAVERRLHGRIDKNSTTTVHPELVGEEFGVGPGADAHENKRALDDSLFVGAAHAHAASGNALQMRPPMSSSTPLAS